METSILLENGTNEVEILEFTLGDNHYGINVAKIREILVWYEQILEEGIKARVKVFYC